MKTLIEISLMVMVVVLVIMDYGVEDKVVSMIYNTQAGIFVLLYFVYQIMERLDEIEDKIQ